MKKVVILVIGVAIFVLYRIFFPSQLSGVKIIKFPNVNKYTSHIQSTLLINDDEESANLLVRFGSMSQDSVIGVRIDKKTGNIRTDYLKDLYYGLGEISHINLGCNKVEAFCLLISNQMLRGLIVPLSILRYDYKTGNNSSMYDFPRDTQFLWETGYFDGKIFVKTPQNIFSISVNPSELNTKTLAKDDINSSMFQTNWYYDKESLEKPQLPVPDYKREQDVSVENKVISDGCSGLCSVTIDHYLKKRDGRVVFKFRSVNSNIQPLGYFSGRYYFHGSLAEFTNLRGFWGIVNLQDKID